MYEQSYIRQWQEHEGISLDASKIIKNSGIRAISKLALNSLWGKFGQNLNFTFYEDFMRLLADPKYEVTDVQCAGSNMMLINYKQNNETEEAAPFSNIPVACFTTSHARLHLLSLMEKVASKVLYSDTDSIFLLDTNGSELPESIFLGDL